MVKVKPSTPELTEEYFPERNAMVSHLRQMRDLISAQSKDHKLKRRLAMSSTSNESYGGFYHTPRKDKSPREYFDPWYRHSCEYGKYVSPLPVPSAAPSELLTIINSRQSQQAKLKDQMRKSRCGYTSEFSTPLRLPPIKSNVINGPDKPTNEEKVSFYMARQKLQPAPVNSLVNKAMNRLWNDISAPLSSNKHGGSLDTLLGQHGGRHAKETHQPSLP